MALYMPTICIGSGGSSSLFLTHHAESFDRSPKIRAETANSESGGGAAALMKTERGGDADQHDNAAGLVGDADLAAFGGPAESEGADFAPHGSDILQPDRLEFAPAAGRVDHLEMIKGH
jgi:hypothetical protein